MGERLKVLLSGMVAGEPRQGGASWAVLQYLAGLRELGHDVFLVEPVGAAQLASPQVRSYFDGLPLPAGRAALHAEKTRLTFGCPFAELERFARGADLLLNLSGTLRDERLLAPIPVRAFLDLDPGFNQVWHETGEDMGFERHTHFATVGQAVGRPGCPVPSCGRRWIATLPPVALEHWGGPAAAPRRPAFTSVGHWRSYGCPDHGGLRYGQRAHSMRELIELPRLSAAPYELALGIHPEETSDRRALRANGWRLLEPDAVAGTPAAYRDFVRGSMAELCVAKSGYVSSRGGWLSDRSACYLASGRPVVAQDTGFGEALPTGEGLLTFGDLGGAVEAVACVSDELERHSLAARAIAEEHLDARRVLGRLLERLAAAPAPVEVG